MDQSRNYLACVVATALLAAGIVGCSGQKDRQGKTVPMTPPSEVNQLTPGATTGPAGSSSARPPRPEPSPPAATSQSKPVAEFKPAPAEVPAPGAVPFPKPKPQPQRQARIDIAPPVVDEQVGPPKPPQLPQPIVKAPEKKELPARPKAKKTPKAPSRKGASDAPGAEGPPAGGLTSSKPMLLTDLIGDGPMVDARQYIPPLRISPGYRLPRRPETMPSTTPRVEQTPKVVAGEPTVHPQPVTTIGPYRPLVERPPAGDEADLRPEPVPTPIKQPTVAPRVVVPPPDVTPGGEPTPQPIRKAEPVPVVVPRPPIYLPIMPPEPPLRKLEVGETQVVTASSLQVNDRLVTVEGVLRLAGVDLARLPRRISRAAFEARVRKIVESEIRRQVRDALILREALKWQGQREKGIIDEEMDRWLREKIAEAGGTRRQLEQYCIDQGFTLSEALASHRRDLMVEMYLRQRFLPAVSIARRDLTEYYHNHIEEFTTLKKVQMQIIAAPWKEFLAAGVGRRPTDEQIADAGVLALKAISTATEALKSGGDFGLVARRHSRGIKASQGGVWPIMEADSFSEAAVEAEAFKLEEGGVSGIIETDSGYYIVKARKVAFGTRVSFEDAQEEINARLRKNQLDELSGKYYLKLFRNAMIVESSEFADEVVLRAVERYYRN